MILATLLVAAAIGGLFLFGQKRLKTLPVATEEKNTIAPWPSTTLEEEQIKESGKGYAITAVYPVTASDTVNAHFKDFVYTTIAQFKDDISWINDPTVEFTQTDMILDIGFTQRKQDRADNYIFSIATYTGGAHGLEAAKTFSFNEQGKLINVSDLFTDQTKGLVLVSNYTQKELVQKGFDQKWVSEGAGALSENYQNFVITDEGLTVLFDPYQVAPYAAGPQRVDIPYATFKSVANKRLFE
jgi:hypothetical protein